MQEPAYTHTREPQGEKSLRLIRAAVQRGMRLTHGGRGGRVVLPTGRLHKCVPQYGRHRINLSVDGDRCTIQTARVVCFLAHGEPPTPCCAADHIDGDTLNDDPSNLRWATYSENLRNNGANRAHAEQQRRAELWLNALAD